MIAKEMPASMCPSASSSHLAVMESAVVVILSVILSIGLLSMCVHRVRAQNAEMRAVAAIVRNRQTPAPAVAEGIDPEAINGFPMIKYSEMKEVKIGKGIIECSVCLSEFNDEDLVRLLPECDHVFHPLCIDKWLASHATCPVCRTNLLHVPETHNSSVSNGVVIHINDDDDRHSTANLISSEASKSHLTTNQTVQISSSETVDLHNSQSTGDSGVRRCEDFDKHALRLPKDVEKKLQLRREVKDEELNVVVLSHGEGCSRMGYRNVDDQLDKS